MKMNVSVGHDEIAVDESAAVSESEERATISEASEIEVLDLDAPMRHFHRTMIKRGLQAGPTANPLRIRLI